MNINYLEIRSAITPVNENLTGTFFEKIEKAGDLTFNSIGINEWKNAEHRVIYIATGGTEGIFRENFELLTDKPCYILTSGESNSLAASMEILSYLKQTGKKGEILHGDPTAIASRLNAITRAEDAIKKVRNSRLGVFGKPSDWLISSVYDKKQLAEKFNITLIEIPMEEIIDEIRKNTYNENEYTESLKSRSYDQAEIDKALYVYGAFSRIVEKNSLDGFTVRCFDLLDTVCTTGCLALAILNAEGIYAGCEGDVPALLSMLILGSISGHPVFQCNPSRINLRNEEMVLAHCTLPLNMPDRFELTTHFESGIGIGIIGSLPKGDMTIFKTSGTLDRYYVNNGKLVENLREANLCRTQIKVKLDDYTYFTTDPISNHHIVCTGNYTEAIEEFFKNLDY